MILKCDRLGLVILGVSCCPRSPCFPGAVGNLEPVWFSGRFSARQQQRGHTDEVPRVFPRDGFSGDNQSFRVLGGAQESLSWDAERCLPCFPPPPRADF